MTNLEDDNLVLTSGENSATLNKGNLLAERSLGCLSLIFKSYFE